MKPYALSAFLLVGSATATTFHVKFEGLQLVMCNSTDSSQATCAGRWENMTGLQAVHNDLRVKAKDTIVLGPGKYTGSGNSNLAVLAIEKGITVEAAEPGKAVLDGNNQRLVVYIKSTDGTVALKGLNITGGKDVRASPCAPIGPCDGGRVQRRLGQGLRNNALSMVADTSGVGRHEYDRYAISPRFWSRFGAPRTIYGLRNSVLAAMLGEFHPRRVFEFAGNGGFFTQRALNTSSVIERLDMWTHSDLSYPALKYAVALLSDDRSIAHPDVDCVRIYRSTYSGALPYSRTWTTPTARDVRITVEHVDVDAPTINANEWGSYDAFATISFEHIRNDLELIRNIPSQATFVFSVATFPLRGEHARHFTTAQSIRERYGELLDIRQVQCGESTAGRCKKLVVAAARK